MITRLHYNVRPWYEVVGAAVALVVISLLISVALNQGKYANRWEEWQGQRNVMIPKMLESDSVTHVNDATLIRKVDSCISVLLEIRKSL